MNVFRNKKKGKEEAESVRPSMESDSAGPFRMFSKKKGQVEENKLELDLSTALPSTNDFRTSLLMTGLSARFSMLREQDDPTTKLGKASDDSVLFPKGMSKMTDFSLGGLQDIAEVESIRTPSISRLDGFNMDDDGSISGSVMNRAKPVDGNNLFGGRQKVYRLPANSSGAAKDGNMSSRTIYDDDVGMSAFQKWRLAEKEKQAAEGGEPNNMGDFESQSELPLESLQETQQESEQESQLESQSEFQSDASRRRETSSTVSSVAARLSAATSVTSQGAPSVKDSQLTPSTSSSSAERSVLRTKRLYEQGLSRELHEQQSSPMYRMDNLSKARPFASATPDVASPVAGAFGDRILERRPNLLAKASAPNLRSFSPSMTGSPSPSPAEPSPRFPSAASPKPNFGIPPISPPISETEDHPLLSIQPNDRGKATAMGVFDRPAERYDESTYAQRQLQLQQGRETPVKNHHHSMESGVTAVSDDKLQAASAVLKLSAGTKNLPEDPPSFFDDSDEDSSMLSGLLNSTNPPRVSVERPNDGDHPAFKNSAVPAPLSLLPRSPGGLSAASSPATLPPQDSPTLGPNTGLSGMVRAHLRSDSNASSIYGVLGQDAEHSNVQNNALRSPDFDSGSSSARQTANVRPMTSRSPSRSRMPIDEADREEDDFARHLADGARRVREKLGSMAMVETEMERSSPSAKPSLENLRDANAPRTNALGILKSKSSHTSLFDRHARDQSQPRAMKAVISSASNGASSPSRRGSTENPEDSRRGRSTQARERYSEDAAATDKEEGVHVGLKAFRQARMELQKMKDLEPVQRAPERPSMGSRVGSYDVGGPPPAMFNRKARDESRHGSGSRAASRTGSRAPSERERSGSETSNAGPPPIRSMRLRNGSTAYDDQHTPASPPGSARSGSGMRHGPPSARRPYEAGQPSPMASPISMGTRSRNGSLLGATASTPNLLSNAPAPPLPPINPRRKTLGRASEDDMSASRIPGGFPTHDESDDDTLAQRRQKLRKATSEGTSLRARNNPPSNGARPPMPQGNMPGGRFLPGGVI
ncbi:hypothetical protein ACQKWADRAFT_264216 [Trichoderma austrokoningii]